MAGVLGSLLMLLECSGVGARLALDRLPAPSQMPGWHTATPAARAAQLRWLCAFPSYGYVLAVPPAAASQVLTRFAAADIACADIGEVETGTRVELTLGPQAANLWDFAEQPFIGATAAVAEEALA